MADPKKKEQVLDPRIEFFQSYCLKTMRLKLEKWTKMLSYDENKVSDFNLILHDIYIIIIKHNCDVCFKLLFIFSFLFFKFYYLTNHKLK